MFILILNSIPKPFNTHKIYKQNHIPKHLKAFLSFPISPILLLNPLLLSLGQCLLCSTRLQLTIVYCKMTRRELITRLADRTAKGVQYMATLYECSRNNPLSSLRDLAEVLFDQTIGLYQEGHLDAACKIAVLFNKTIMDFWPTEQPREVASMANEVILSRQIPNKVKKHLKDCIALCIAYQEEGKSRINEDISDQYVFDGFIQSIKKKKNGSNNILHHVGNEGDHSILQGEEFGLMMISFMLSALPKITQKLNFSQKTFSLLKILIDTNQSPQPNFRSLLLKINFVLELLRQLETFGLGDKLRPFLDMLFNSVYLHNLLQSAISHENTRHSVKEVVCSLCLNAEITRQQQKVILDMKIEAFAIIQHLYLLQQRGQYASIYNQKGQNQLVETILTGIHCYFSSEEKAQVDFDMETLRETYVGILLSIYHSILKKRRVVSSEESKLAFFRSLLQQLLTFNQYELQLFNSDSQKFLDLLRDAYQDNKYPSIKANTSKIINLICDIIPGSSEFFIDIAKSSLQRVFNIKTDFQQQHAFYIKSESSLFLLSLFSRKITNYKWTLFFRKIIGLKCLEKMNDLTLTLLLVFFSISDLEVLEEKQSLLHIVELGLNQKNETVKMAALRLVEKISTKIYSHGYFSIIFRQLFFHSNSEESGMLEKWTIIKNVIKFHHSSLKINTKAYILSGIRRLLSLETFPLLNNKPCNLSTFYNCIDLTLELLYRSIYTQVDQYVKRCLIDISCFFRYLPLTTLKHEMAQIIQEVLLIDYNQKNKISLKMVKLIDSLVYYYKSTQDSAVLKIFELYIIIFHQKNKHSHSEKIFCIFQLFIAKVSSLIAHRQLDQTALYGSLIILNKYVLYFGKVSTRSKIDKLIYLCRKLLKRYLSRILKARVFNTLFSCSLYTSEDLMLSEIIQMKSQLINLSHPFELQILLNTLDICFSTSFAGGSLEKYRYLTELLFEISVLAAFNCQNLRISSEIGEIIQNMTQTCKISHEIYQQCCRIRKVFKKHKKIAYFYTKRQLSPLIRGFLSETEFDQVQNQQDSSLQDHIRPFGVHNDERIDLSHLFHRYIYSVNINDL